MPVECGDLSHYKRFGDCSQFVVDHNDTIRIDLSGSQLACIVWVPFHLCDTVSNLYELNHLTRLDIPNLQSVGFECHCCQQILFFGVPIDTRDTNSSPYV